MPDVRDHNFIFKVHPNVLHNAAHVEVMRLFQEEYRLSAKCDATSGLSRLYGDR
jgi:hypothetical protein